MAACPSCGHDNDGDAKFCSECGTRLEVVAPARETRKTVTVLFCDVAGSTALGERLDPETVRVVMTRYFDRMRDALEAHGGTVEKFIGDAVMAVFGVPVVSEEDALRAVRAADAMRTSLAVLNDELRAERGVAIETRIGINTGPVVAGDPASGQNLVTGDTVNTAARLEQAAGPGETLIGEATFALVRDAVQVEAVDPLSLKGKADDVPAYRLLEVRALAAGHERRLDSPMVGRDRPLRMLTDAFEAATSDATCHLFTVFGPAGIGKSRLVREFMSEVGGSAEVLSGRCLSYGDGIAFWPVTEMAIQAAGIAEDDDPERARAAVRDLLRDLPDGDLVAAHLAGVMGLAGDGPVEAAWALRRFLEAVATRRPVVAVFDDIHWAEPALLDAIEHVADRSRDLPILVLCMARPEFLDTRAGWGGGMRNATSVHLEPLSDVESDALIENLLGNPALTPEIRERIRASAQGNPLFVEEVLAMLLDDGILVKKDDEWTSTVDLTTVEVPPAISALLAARLEKLSPQERTMLETASVIGEVFERSTLASLVDDGQRSDIDRLLGALLRKDLIRPSRSDVGAEEAYRFRHILLRDAAYETIPKAERSRLHERFAEGLAASLGERAAEFDEFIGYHLERATDLRRELGLVDERTRELAAAAFGHLQTAGLRAFIRGDLTASSSLLSHANAVADPDDPRRLTIAYPLGESLNEGGALAESRDAMEDLVALAARIGDASAERIARTIADAAAFFLGLEPVAVIKRDSDRVLAEADDGSVEQAFGWMYRSRHHWVSGDYAAAGEAATRASAAARAAGDAYIEREMRTEALAAGAVGPMPYDDALPLAQQAIDDARRAGDRGMESRVMRAAAAMLAHLGRTDEARRTVDAAREISLDIGARIAHLGSAQLSAMVSRFAGDLDGAATVLRETSEALEALGETAYLSTNAAQLAALEVDRGDLRAADRWLSVAEATGAPDDVSTQVGIAIARGNLAAARLDRDTAERELRRAVEMTTERGAFSERIESRLALARFLASSDRRDEAHEVASEALALAAAKRAVADQRQIRELLETIG